MRIIWINVHASLIGGCEYYILNTVRLLREKGVHSTLLYQPLASVEGDFLAEFAAAFPMVDLKQQLKEIPHDLIYVHQLFDDASFKILAQDSAPVIRFFQDCSLFHLNMYKNSLSISHPFQSIAGFRCFPLFFSIQRSSKFPGIKFNTFSQMKNSQVLNQKLDGFIVGSHFMEQLLIDNGFDSVKAHVLPLYADKPSDSFVEREKDLILFVGQLIRGKGVDLLLKALKMTTFPYRLVLAGKGKQEKEFQKLTKKLELANRVQFIGKVNQQELNSWYKRASSVVLPTRVPESFGLVGIEAMRYGTPVIAPPLGGITDWLEDGKTGLSVQPENSLDIARSLDRIWKDSHLVKTIRQTSPQRYLEKYTPSLHVNAILDLFKTYIREKKIKTQTKVERLTVKGTPEMEAQLHNMLNEVKDIMTTHFSPAYREALLLIGGYGKGEGGIELKGGKCFAHNNLDLLLLTQPMSQDNLKKTKKKILELLVGVTEKYQIGFDISVIPFQKLMHSPHLLIWYEMYHGHRLLLGNQDTIARLPFSDIKTVPKEEILALLINRGSLLIINDWIFDQHLDHDPQYRKIIVKHLVKAIIGYGDALLFFLEDYHWSYCEKLKRILKNPMIPEKFRSLYKEAAEFRFEPDYEKYLSKNLKEWTESIRPQLAEIFLRCESIRMLETDLTWDNYVDVSLKNSIREEPLTVRTIGTKLAALKHFPHHILGETWLAKCGFCLLSPSKRLRIAFPFLAFHVYQELLNTKISQYLNAEGTRIAEIRIAYLKHWGAEVDTNFSRSLKEWKLSL